MTPTSKLRFAGLIAAALMLQACGNSPYRADPFRTLYDSLFKGDGEPTKITAQQIVQTLSATDRPVAFLEIIERDSQSLLIRIEQNGGYDSFATPTRQAVTMRHGMIVGTRGLGGDLMSVEEDAVLRVVRARESRDNVIYVQRFLTPEYLTEPLTYTCNIEPDKSVDAAMGLVNTHATEVVVACTGEDLVPFVDYYVVDSNGEIVASRQWLGEVTGYVAMHMLRL